MARGVAGGEDSMGEATDATDLGRAAGGDHMDMVIACGGHDKEGCNRISRCTTGVEKSDQTVTVGGEDQALSPGLNHESPTNK
jgi:hypothetical protein